MDILQPKDLFIDEVKIGQSEGGFACGPVDGDFHLSIKLVDAKGSTIYFIMHEFEGYCEFNCSYTDDFKLWLNHFNEDYERLEKVSNATKIEKVGKLVLKGSYEELFDSIYDNKLQEKPEGKLLRYAVLVMSCPYSDLETNVKLGLKKNVDDLVLPIECEEEDYISTHSN